MAGWNGSGVFTKTYSWVQDQLNGIKILATRHDQNDTDFTNGINNCLTKDGQNSPSANLPMGGFKHTGAANATATGQYLVYGQDVTTDDLAVGGTLTVTGTSTLNGATTVDDTLNVTGATTLAATSITGGLDNNSGGITEAGAISGATTIAASGNVTVGGTLTVNGSLFTPLVPKQIIISNNVTDANNDIDFAAGNFPFSDGTGIAALSAITKRLDATWAVGTNQGGLDTGSKANSTWYHCYAIYNPTTFVSDALFSTSASGPTLPSGYTKFKRVGSILTDGSGNIRAFTQAGDIFNWTTVIASISAASQTAGSETLRTLATPLGVKTKAIINFYGAASSAGAVNVKAYSADISSATLAVTDGQLYVVNGVTNGLAYVEAITNTSSQIKTNSVNTSGAPTIAITIIVNGWQDITL